MQKPTAEYFQAIRFTRIFFLCFEIRVTVYVQMRGKLTIFPPVALFACVVFFLAGCSSRKVTLEANGRYVLATQVWQLRFLSLEAKKMSA